MPASLITTLTPSFSSETVADKVATCVNLMETEIPKIYFKHSTGAYSWFLYKQWRFDATQNANVGFGNHTYFPYNNAAYNGLVRCDSNLNGGHLGWMKFVNDFAPLDMGILYCEANYNMAIIPGYISKRLNSYSDFDTAKLYIPNQTSSDSNSWHTILGTTDNNGSSKLDDFKLFTYSSFNLAYVGFMNMDRCIIATKGYSLDDPSNVISVLIISCINTENEFGVGTTAANTIDILMQGSRVPITYINTIGNIPQSTSFSKLVLHKFVQNGYYFDNIYSYSGTLPSNHFTYNGSEYVKIACNLLIKFG